MPDTATPPPPQSVSGPATCVCTNTVESTALTNSFEYCRRITRARARNFYYGLKLTPEPKRSALYAVYAYMRACDDLADADNSEAKATPQHIEDFRRQTEMVLDGQSPPESTTHAEVGDLWPAFRHTMLTYPIDRALLHAMLDGQLRDLDPAPYSTYDELYQYCYNVASVVGLTCIAVWGYTGGAATRKLAEQRGIALQLTNILRDLVEDADRGRLYLPTDKIMQFGLVPDTLIAQLRDRRPSQDLNRLINYFTTIARDYYKQSDTLESFIDPACRPTSRAVVRIYRSLLEKIARRPQRVLTERVRLTKLHKIVIALTSSRKNA